MEDTRLDAASTAIALRMGPDISYLQPPGEARFDPLTVGIDVGKVLLLAFGTGFVAAYTDKAKQWGREVETWLAVRLRRAFTHRDPAGDREVGPEASSDPIDQLIAAQADLEASKIAAYADESEKTLAAGLIAAGMPVSKATALAHQVRAAALQVASRAAVS